MFIDSRDIAAGSALDATVCIVGAGAAGITLARDLGRSGVDVLLLEAGGRKAEAASQARYRGTVTDARLHSPLDRYRQRRYGGTTTIWGGRCTPLDAIDFEARPWVGGSPWPFGLEELSPWYAAANEACEAGRFDYAARLTGEGAMRPIIRGFEGLDFTMESVERFSRPTDFGRLNAPELGNSLLIRTVLHANVVHVQLAGDGRSVLHLDVAGREPSQRWRVRAQHFVVAAGGLESTRLLLAGRDVHAEGIGNHHDLLGRHYMCHLAGTIGAVHVQRPAQDIWHGYERVDGGIYCRRRFALRPEAQRSHRLPNMIARLHHPRVSDAGHGSGMLSLLYLMRPLVPWEYARRLYDAEGGRMPSNGPHLRNVVRAPFDAFAFGWQMLTKRMLASRKFPSIIVTPRNRVFTVDFHAEQLPNPASRVRLGGERDEFGMPRLDVDWRYLPADVHGVRESLRLLQADLARGGVARFDFDPEVVEAEMVRYGAYGGHHIGTIRMGADKNRSLVNADGRVHDVANLYVAGAATFPTSSQANPTLTIVAMALRMAAHLKGAAA